MPAGAPVPDKFPARNPENTISEMPVSVQDIFDIFFPSAPGNNPDGMHDAGDIPQERQENVQPEGSLESHLEKNAKRR
jgi:hypothetical protein